MLQPVLRDITIDEGISGDGGETKQEEEPQSESGQRDPEKKPEVLAHELAHAKNIPQLSKRAGAAPAARVAATDCCGFYT
jgi:hypothetical protein